jgi:hypothetical protein
MSGAAAAVYLLLMWNNLYCNSKFDNKNFYLIGKYVNNNSISDEQVVHMNS